MQIRLLFGECLAPLHMQHQSTLDTEGRFNVHTRSPHQD